MALNTTNAWYWRKEKLGQYLVKTAYNLLQESHSAAHSSNSLVFWRNLKIPAKVKHFFWSASIGCLPTKDRLREKKVMVNELCPICNMEPKYVLHILPTCSSCSFTKECFINIGKVVSGDYNE